MTSQCTKTSISNLLLSSLLIFTAVQAGAALDAPHNASRNIGCLSCHQMTSTYPKLLRPLGRSPLDIDDTTGNNVCWSCHNGSDAPYRATHSSLLTDNGSGNWTVECWVCHNQHLQEQDRYNGSTYGKYIRRSINLANIANGGKTGIKAVVFTGPATFADGDTAYNGVCEVCHDGTGHYQGDGSSPDQNHVNIAQFGQANPGLDTRECTFCHSHRDGFRPSCPDCHGLPPTVATVGGPNSLVGPGTRLPASGQPYGKPVATGSATSGQHTLHATPAGYNYPCSTCHFGGMHATMTADDAKVDHQIQIGFSGAAILGRSNGQDTSYNGQSTLSVYTYQGTNSTTTSASDGMTCANTYCHSNGTSVATGTIPVNTSLKWDGASPDPQGDGFDCNNCHGYPPAYAHDDPKSNTHLFVPHKTKPCSDCHYSTTNDGIHITDATKHLNGQFDVVNNLNVGNSFTYTFDKGGGRCSSGTAGFRCHGLSHTAFTPEPPWGAVWGRETCYFRIVAIPGGDCFEMNFSLAEDTNNTCRLPGVSYLWNFGDGTNSTDAAPSHTYPSGATSYIVGVTVRDADNHPGSALSGVYVPAAPNTPPAANASVSVSGRTVTLTDLSYDPDYNLCSHSGPGRIAILWGNGADKVDQPIPLTDSPSGQVYSYSYPSVSSAVITHYVYDNTGSSVQSKIGVFLPSTPGGITISGRVTRVTNGLPLSGVIMRLKQNGTVWSSPYSTTNSLGYYHFINVPAGCYSVLPTNPSGYSVNPVESDQVCTTNAEVNFTATP